MADPTPYAVAFLTSTEQKVFLWLKAFLALLTKGHKATVITMSPQSVRQSVCPSVCSSCGPKFISPMLTKWGIEMAFFPDDASAPQTWYSCDEGFLYRLLPWKIRHDLDLIFKVTEVVIKMVRSTFICGRLCWWYCINRIAQITAYWDVLLICMALGRPDLFWEHNSI